MSEPIMTKFSVIGCGPGSEETGATKLALDDARKIAAEENCGSEDNAQTTQISSYVLVTKTKTTLCAMVNGNIECVTPFKKEPPTGRANNPKL